MMGAGADAQSCPRCAHAQKCPRQPPWEVLPRRVVAQSVSPAIHPESTGHTALVKTHGGNYVGPGGSLTTTWVGNGLGC